MNDVPEGIRLHCYELHTVLGARGFSITCFATGTNLGRDADALAVSRVANAVARGGA